MSEWGQPAPSIDDGSNPDPGDDSVITKDIDPTHNHDGINSQKIELKNIVIRPGEIKNIVPAEAGEAIKAGDCVCIRTNELVKSTATHDARVLESAGDTNYGTDTTAIIGATDATDTGKSYFFVKFDLDSINVTTGDVVYLRLAVTSSTGTIGDLFRLRCYRNTNADWDESTITWNNKPTTGSTADSQDFSKNGLFNELYLCDSSTSRNYVFFDITTEYNLWKGGSNNYGLIVRFIEKATSAEETTAAVNITVGTSENSNSTLRPTLIVMGASDDAGKAFLAKDELRDWTNLFGRIGFAQGPAAIGDNVTVQIDGVVDNPTGGALTTGSRYYVGSSTAGEISTWPNTYNWRAVGIALSSSKLLMQVRDFPIIHDYVTFQAGDTTDGAQVNFQWYLPVGLPINVSRFDGKVTADGTDYPAIGVRTVQNANTNTNGVVTQDGQSVVDYTDTNTAANLSIVQDTGLDPKSVLIDVTLRDENVAYNNIEITGLLTLYP